MNVNSPEPGDLDSALADEVAEPKPKQHPDNVEENPDDVKDGSAQDGKEPLAGA